MNKPAGQRGSQPWLRMAGVACLGVLTTACSGERPSDLGPVDGRLRPCPDSPNCVCSYDSDEQHAIAPFNSDLMTIAQTLNGLQGVDIITSDGDYMHAEFSSRFFRFVDDVEFYADKNAGVVHVRSASRLGHSDLGVNRKRIEQIRAGLPGG